MLALALAVHLCLAATDAAVAAVPAASVVGGADGSAALDLSAGGGAPSVAASATTAALAPAPPPRLSAITLAPQQLDHGPFRPGELAAATIGAFAGDAIVLGSGYLALQMFASGQLSPTAAHFRHAVYGLGVSALVLPPLTAVLMAKLTGSRGRGSFLKAMLLATAGQAAALAAGYYFAPHFWVVLPVQAIALSVGTSVGLHWGRGRAPAADSPEASPDTGHERVAPPGTTALVGVRICPDG